MASILLINGPNLNLLGKREPQLYGTSSLDEINARLQTICDGSSHQLECMQSNAESAIIDCIHAAHEKGVSFIIINPAALTHTSVALRDALLGVNIPFIEVHLSNIHAREPFRHHSHLSDIAAGCIIGLGPLGYELALQAVIEKLSKPVSQ